MNPKFLTYLLCSVLWSAPLCLAEEQVSTTETEEKVNETSSSISATAKDATSDGTQSLEEALDKKPGINFSTVQIGGQSSGISLSSIRADSVESLEALKLGRPCSKSLPEGRLFAFLCFELSLQTLPLRL